MTATADILDATEPLWHQAESERAAVLRNEMVLERLRREREQEQPERFECDIAFGI